MEEGVTLIKQQPGIPWLEGNCEIFPTRDFALTTNPVLGMCILLILNFKAAPRQNKLCDGQECADCFC